MNGRQEYRMGVGATSMLMIFVMLALTTLSVLSLSSAKSDLSMTRRNVELLTAYYDAAADAQDVIAQVDEKLQALHDDASTAEKYEQDVREMQIPGEFLHYISTDTSVQFSLDAGGGRALEVELEVLPFSTEDSRYEVRRHQLVNDTEWIPESDLVLFGG